MSLDPDMMCLYDMYLQSACSKPRSLEGSIPHKLEEAHPDEAARPSQQQALQAGDARFEKPTFFDTHLRFPPVRTKKVECTPMLLKEP